MSATSHARTRQDRVAEIVVAVARQMMTDRQARRIALLDDGSPEAALAADLLSPLGEDLVRVTCEQRQMDSLLHAAGVLDASPAASLEAHRLLVRLVPASISCIATTRTDLLVGGELPPETFLPLGDLFASEVLEMGGGWNGSGPARSLAEAAGGLERLDHALRSLLDGRDEAGLNRLPDGLAGEVTRALRSGSAARIHFRIVPKLGYRTIGVDLFQ